MNRLEIDIMRTAAGGSERRESIPDDLTPRELEALATDRQTTARIRTIVELQQRVRDLEGMLDAFQRVTDCWCPAGHDPAKPHVIRCAQVRQLLDRR